MSVKLGELYYELGIEDQTKKDLADAKRSVQKWESSTSATVQVGADWKDAQGELKSASKAVATMARAPPETTSRMRWGISSQQPGGHCSTLRCSLLRCRWSWGTLRTRPSCLASIRSLPAISSGTFPERSKRMAVTVGTVSAVATRTEKVAKEVGKATLEVAKEAKTVAGVDEALKRGDYDAAQVRVTRSDEIGLLGRTFNVMIDVLRQRERERPQPCSCQGRWPRRSAG